jgi:hypothetical protein
MSVPSSPMPSDTNSHSRSLPFSTHSPHTSGLRSCCSLRSCHITNNHFQAAFTPFWQLGLSLTVIRDKARKANRPVPINDDHTEFCLSFHVLSSCW